MVYSSYEAVRREIMDTVTIGTRNQLVIPLRVRKKLAGIMPGSKVKIYSADQNTVIIKTNQASWLKNSYGLIKHGLKSLQSDKIIDKDRDQW